MNLAARGARQLERDVERIEDRSELVSVRGQAARVMWKALLAAAVLTIAALWL